jgi:hypothetical protein
LLGTLLLVMRSQRSLPRRQLDDASCAAAGRPLGLLVRGGIELLPRLRAAFATVTVLETMTFLKTMMRQRIVLREDGSARWRSAPTPRGAPVDPLFAINRAGVESWIEGPLSPAPSAAEV